MPNVEFPYLSFLIVMHLYLIALLIVGAISQGFQFPIDSHVAFLGAAGGTSSEPHARVAFCYSLH